jgi:signal peptidase I
VTDASGTERRRSTRVAIRDWVLMLLVAVAAAWSFQTWVIQSFSIPSESMAPTLTNGDRVLVNKLSYRAHDVHRGDVVVVRRPPRAARASSTEPEDLIKRVIGLPGDLIETRGGHVYIDGRELTEPYLRKGMTTDQIETPYRVPKGQVFLMGDNRIDSRDSRSFGPVPEGLVVGRAFARIWPPNRVGFL